MSALHTSFETSLALREAGAVQIVPAGGAYYDTRISADRWVNRGGPHCLGSPMPDARECLLRAFRADEVLAELWLASVRDVVLVRIRERAVVVEVFDTDSPVSSSIEGIDGSLVEAAAACWLAVLAQPKEPGR